MAVVLVLGAACSAKPLGSDTPSPSAATSSTPTETSSAAPTEAAPSATAQPSPAAEVVTTAPDDLVASLTHSGIHLTPPDRSVPVTAGDIAAAIDVARANFGPAGDAVGFPATVTVDGYHVGDENSPLMIDGRQVIVVQITGLDMPHGGGYGDSIDPAENSHELVVLVDAKTMEYLMGSSNR